MKRWQVRINRQNSIKMGSIFYTGSICSKFPSHGGRRYVVSCNCVACDRAKSKAINAGRPKTGFTKKRIVVKPPYTEEQMERLQSGRAEKFFGRACQHGHDGLRYVNGGMCVACSEASRPPKGLGKSDRLKWARDRRRERKAKESTEMFAMVEQAKKMRAAEAALLVVRTDEYDDLF